MKSRFELVRSGEIDERSAALRRLVSPCCLCPRRCGVDRLAGRAGLCGTSGAVVSAATAHFGEEPEVTGPGGSGCIFFAGCNLRCVYCQNHEISQGQTIEGGLSHSADIAAISDAMLQLQSRGCSNINLVTPSHVAWQAVEAVGDATRRGLTLPIVWNSSSYESVGTLKLLEGIVDVYLADLRYSDNMAAIECSAAADYVEMSRSAVLEMASQVGTANVCDDRGVVLKGLIIRLLVLPNDMAGVRETLDFIAANLGTGVRISLMSQYFPSHRALSDPLLSRPVSPTEYDRAVRYAEKLGFENALIQEMEAAEFYRPDFSRHGEPFVDAAQFKGGRAKSSETEG